MIRLRCPHCQAVVEAAPELAGTVQRCGRCQGSVPVPAELVPTRAAVAPGLPPGQVQEHVTEAPPALTGPAAAGETWDAGLAASAAVRWERDRLAAESLPDLADVGAEPLPVGKWIHADDLGEPIASVRVSGERAGGDAAVLLLALASAWGLLWFANQAAGGLPALALGGVPGRFVLAGLAIGAAVGLLVLARFARRRYLARTYWICPAGVVWRQGRVVDWCRWADVGDVFVDDGLGRRRYRVALRGARAVFAGPRSAAAVRVGAYVAVRAAQALLPACVERLCRGKAVPFGLLVMDRRRLRWGMKSAPWADVARVTADERGLQVNLAGRPGWLVLPAGTVPHPLLAEAVARVLQKELPAE